MPYDDPDPTDPMTLHGVAMETDDENATVEMAECFIEEYARMGFSADRIARMFEDSGYAGPHLAYRLLGERRIAELIGEHMERCGFRRPRSEDLVETRGDGRFGLRVLDGAGPAQARARLNGREQRPT